MSNTNPDICIIGSGVAGALIANHLAASGLKVVVLEAGPRFEASRRMELMQRRIGGTDPWPLIDKEEEIYTNTGSYKYNLKGTRLRAVGGSTHHWGGVAYRLHASDFRLKSLYGIGEDWPLDYDELEPFYQRAEEELGVSGQSGDPFASWRSCDFPMSAFPFSYADKKVIKPACDKLGIHLHTMPFARNSREYNGRPGCQAFGVCNVCPIEAMYNAEAHIKRAETTGNLQLIPQARVVSLSIDSDHRVRKAKYIRPDGTQESLIAPMFVLAAHTIESIRLLLLSQNELFPDGLANSSGTLGRYFMEHWSTGMSGVVARSHYPKRIGFNTAHTLQFYDTPQRHDIGAMKITFAAGSPNPSKLAIESKLWGQDLKKHIRESHGRRLAAVVNIEQLPDKNNRISLDPVLLDKQGYAAPRIHLDVGEYERHTLRKGREILIKIVQATGATIPESQMKKVQEEEFHPIAHHMGGCRMGNNAHRSVVDSTLKAHDHDNLYIVGSSVFPTGGAMNPTLTLAALALRTAEKIERRLRRT